MDGPTSPGLPPDHKIGHAIRTTEVEHDDCGDRSRTGQERFSSSWNRRERSCGSQTEDTAIGGIASSIRAHFAEFGIVVGQGIRNVERLLALLGAEGDNRLPALAAEMLGVLAEQLRETAAGVSEVEIKLLAWHRANPASRRLESIPGIGPITASAIVATVGDPRQFQSGRQFAAWLGLVPQQRSSGGKERLGGISKRGDGYIRRLLVHGARAIVGWQKRSAAHTTPWIERLLKRRPMNVATVAYANKLARIAWAIMIREDRYNPVRAFAVG